MWLVFEQQIKQMTRHAVQYKQKKSQSIIFSNRRFTYMAGLSELRWY